MATHSTRIFAARKPLEASTIFGEISIGKEKLLKLPWSVHNLSKTIKARMQFLLGTCQKKRGFNFGPQKFDSNPRAQKKR